MISLISSIQTAFILSGLGNIFILPFIILFSILYVFRTDIKEQVKKVGSWIKRKVVL